MIAVLGKVTEQDLETEGNAGKHLCPVKQAGRLAEQYGRGPNDTGVR
jgi:hypothetical protein